MRKEDKRAQGLSITSIILIVMGILILVILILGFTMGWNRILPWINPPNNVEDIAAQCGFACSLDQQYNYCSRPVDLKSENEDIEDTTCYILAAKRPVYGIETCPEIICDIKDNIEAAQLACVAVGDNIAYIDDVKLGSLSCTGEDVTKAEEAKAEAKAEAEAEEVAKVVETE